MLVTLLCRAQLGGGSYWRQLEMCHRMRAIGSVLRHSAADKKKDASQGLAEVGYSGSTSFDLVRSVWAATEPGSSCHGDTVCSGLLRWRGESDSDCLWGQGKACLYCMN